MSHTCSLLTEIEETDLRRLFDHSEAKAREGTVRRFECHGKSSDEFYTTIKSAVLSHIAGVATSVIGYYKNDVLCWIGWGFVGKHGKMPSNTFHQIGFLAGQDAEGSRAWLYADTFWDCLKEFHESNGVGRYGNISTYNVKDSSADQFYSSTAVTKLYEKNNYNVVRDLDIVEPSIESTIGVSLEGVYLGQEETFRHVSVSLNIQ